MSAHTSGPWYWDGKVWDYDKTQDAPWLVKVKNKTETVLTGQINCKSEANARLIANAPCLLKRLQAAINALDRLTDRVDGSDDFTNALDEIDLGNAAIAKATGAAA